ncbi:MAG: hypothetical protein ACRCU6_00145 [Fusobacteriaceae bacterium]
MKLDKSIEINNTIIEELDISQEKFTAGVIIDSEKEFLVTGGIFPTGQMEESKAYLLYVASKMTGHRFHDLKDKLSGADFLKVTSTIRGFFFGSAAEELILRALGKQ